ncbi:MAG TPA: site-specific integrase [Micromonosporaceae bacterium]
MPYLRKLPSGKWQATVRHPSGKRITETDDLKGRVKKWATDLEASFARGDLRDPRAGRITVGEWYARWFAARGVDKNTRDRIRSCWETHCEPQWATWPMDAITRMEAQQWVRSLERKQRARHLGRTGTDVDTPQIAAATIHAVVQVMSSLYGAAMDEHPPLVTNSPFAKLDLPRIQPAPVDFLSHEEFDALVAELDANYSPVWAAVVETGCWVGLREGEIFGLMGDRVSWLRQQVEVTRVHTRHGMREHPKTSKSHRVVPVPPDVMARWSALMVDRPRGALVMCGERGAAIDDTNFRHRVWVPALKAAGLRAVPPRIMRHTAASWLVMDGVDLYRVQDLLGHESFATTQRYAHLAPEAHEKVRESWRRMSDARARKTKKASGSE